MCYAIPGKVIELSGKSVTVDYFGEQRKAINELTGLKVGDFIYAQGGFVINQVSPQEAKEVLAIWREMFFELRKTDLRLSRLDLEDIEVDKQFSVILDKALERMPLKKTDLKRLLGTTRNSTCSSRPPIFCVKNISRTPAACMALLSSPIIAVMIVSTAESARVIPSLNVIA